MIALAEQKHPHLEFRVADAESADIEEKFDYIVLSDVVGSVDDLQAVFRRLRPACRAGTRIIISYYNYLWEPLLKLGERFGLKLRQPEQSWLSSFDLINLLELEGFEMIKVERKILFPYKFPFLEIIFNRWLANLPIINRFCLASFIVARFPFAGPEASVSIVIPAKNEKGNIENAVKNIPAFGREQELIFIEGGSADGTYEEMLRVKGLYPDRRITVMRQSGRGKGNAVAEAFLRSQGEILMILDADLTVPPEDLPKFYEALKNGRGEFINGCRLVYPLEKEAMRFLNLLANKFFGIFFSYLLGQRLKDTLCGTKALFRSDYEEIRLNRSYFGDFDPFGDFDLLFGAAKLNLKIREIPVRYRERRYGSTQIRRFAHGWLLLKMCLVAAKKIKFI